jgi:hypothetical protein
MGGSTLVRTESESGLIFKTKIKIYFSRTGPKVRFPVLFTCETGTRTGILVVGKKKVTTTKVN